MGGDCSGVSLTPDKGKVGTTVVLAIESTAFPLGGPYQILWSKSPISEEGDYRVVAEGEVAKGSMEATVTFTIPEATYGTNYIQFRRGWRPEDDPYTFIFNVLPGIEVSPPSASPGSEVTINGTGFLANSDGIKLSFDVKDTDIAIATDDLGSFTAKFTVPDTIAGKHEFKAMDEGVYAAEATASLALVPSINLSPELPQIGSEVTVTGYGFAASSNVSVKYDGIMIASLPRTDELGSFSHVFTVPESPEAEHEIVATDEAGNTAAYSLGLEGKAPPAPATISPQAQRFGWFGSQLVAFAWTEVTDASGVTYTLEIADNLNFFPLAAGMRKTNLTQPNCLVRLEPGTYYWRGRAVDGAGNESEWALSPYPFKVGLFSVPYLIIGGSICFLIFVFIIRAFFRRLREYH